MTGGMSEGQASQEIQATLLRATPTACAVASLVARGAWTDALRVADGDALAVMAAWSVMHEVMGLWPPDEAAQLQEVLVDRLARQAAWQVNRAEDGPNPSDDESSSSPE